MSFPARLQLYGQATVLEFDDGQAVTLPVGVDALAGDVLRHDPPTPAELERAIDIVEDALMQSRAPHAARGNLLTSDPRLSVLPGLESSGVGLSRDAVEALFDRLASRAHGMPVAPAELPHGRDIAAALLILRESMHHLGFDRIAARMAIGQVAQGSGRICERSDRACRREQEERTWCVAAKP